MVLRTCSHAFAVDKVPPGCDQWREFDHEVLGGRYVSYEKQLRRSNIEIVPEAAGHPIVAGIAPSKWKCTYPLYFVSPLAEDAKVLVMGEAIGLTEPVAWIDPYKGGRFSILPWAASMISPTSRSSAPCWSTPFSGAWTGRCQNPLEPLHRESAMRSILSALMLLTVVVAMGALSALAADPPAGHDENKGPRVTLIASEDEYHTDQTFPAFAKLLTDQYGCRCTVLLGEGKNNIPGLDGAENHRCDGLVDRRRTLPKDQLDAIRAYIDAGKPLVALRTRSHGFVVEPGKKAPADSAQWPELRP